MRSAGVDLARLHREPKQAGAFARIERRRCSLGDEREVAAPRSRIVVALGVDELLDPDRRRRWQQPAIEVATGEGVGAGVDVESKGREVILGSIDEAMRRRVAEDHRVGSSSGRRRGLKLPWPRQQLYVLGGDPHGSGRGLDIDTAGLPDHGDRPGDRTALDVPLRCRLRCRGRGDGRRIRPRLVLGGDLAALEARRGFVGADADDTIDGSATDPSGDSSGNPASPPFE